VACITGFPLAKRSKRFSFKHVTKCIFPVRGRRLDLDSSAMFLGGPRYPPLPSQGGAGRKFHPVVLLGQHNALSMATKPASCLFLVLHVRVLPKTPVCHNVSVLIDHRTSQQRTTNMVMTLASWSWMSLEDPICRRLWLFLD